MKMRVGLYLFRRRMFLVAAAMKHALNFVLAVAAFAYVWYAYLTKQSEAATLLKTISALVAILTPASAFYFQYRKYQRKHQMAMYLRTRSGD